jgi:hypothetical protein
VRILAAALALYAGSAAAVPADFKVSTDDLHEPGEQGVELQANKARGWPLQILVEYSLGLSERWQVGLKVPFAREEGLRTLGADVELRYLAPHDREAGRYWGIDLSAGRQRERAGERYVSSVELQPVLGTRAGGWHLALNLPITFPSTGPDRRATLGLQAKASRQVAGRDLGAEYFRAPGDPRTEYLFLAWDKISGKGLNVAVGRGLTGTSERWVLKIACEVPIFQK